MPKFIPNYFVKLRSTNSENIIFLYYIHSFLFSPFSFNSSPHYHYYIFIHFIIIGLNAQTKLQYDAMVYLCLINVLLIFEHDQSHVMIVNGHQTLRSTLFSLFTHLDITNPTPLKKNLVLEI
jgi:integral membrane sensor domain MASE1